MNEMVKKWDWRKLGDVCESIKAGGTPRRNKKEYWENGTIPWLKISDIKNKYVVKSEEKITPKALQESSAKFFKKGTVLYSIFATIGEVAILEIGASCNQAIAGLTPNKEIIDTEYLYYCLKAQKQEILKKKSHATQDNINLTILKNHKIPLPPLPIQKRIVSILEKAEKLKERRKKASEETNKIIQSVFYEMFGDPVKNEKGFPVKELKDVCIKITDGTHKTPTYTETGIPFLRVTDLTESNSTKKYISVEEHKELIKRCKPEKDDILYSKNGTIGIAKVVDWDYEFSIFVSLCLLKPNKEIIRPRYLEAFLNTPFALYQAKSHSKKGTITNLHLIEIKKIKLPLPSLEEQDLFINKVKKIRLIQEKQKKSTEYINQLFDALMQKAFRGEI